MIQTYTPVDPGLDYKKAHCEYLRNQAKQKFYNVRQTWIECGRWALPHRIQWMLSQIEGRRNNQHIVDSTHTLALRSYVAGFLEGNTSASRPWFRLLGQDPESNLVPANKLWLEKYTKRTLAALNNSNFYYAAGAFYYDYGVFNTSSYFIEERQKGLFFHNLVPGSYFAINNAYGEAVVLIREFSYSVKALVDAYGKKDKNGRIDWSNFTPRIRNMYENSNYMQMIDCVHIVMENPHFDPMQPQALMNKRWVSLTYELGGTAGQYYQDGMEFGAGAVDPYIGEVYLRKTASKRKPFIVGKSNSNSNFEYGETGPTLDALGLIKSLNKKAIGKDQALEQMLRPAMQGPANLRKSYLTTAANAYIPLDPTAMTQGGMKAVFQINPAIGSVIQDVTDLRTQVQNHYFQRYLEYLSMNPKTRTATETTAVVQEQQLVIGPNLQSLNWTHNLPLVEFTADYVLDEDPYLDPPPQSLQGQFIRTEFVSVFAQAMKAADLPAINQYMAMIEQVGQLPGGQKIWDKANLDKLADLYEDRLYLPSGLNNPQGKVDAMRQQAMAQAQKQQELHQTIPALAGAAKDMGMSAQQK